MTDGDSMSLVSHPLWLSWTLVGIWVGWQGQVLQHHLSGPFTAFTYTTNLEAFGGQCFFCAYEKLIKLMCSNT